MKKLIKSSGLIIIIIAVILLGIYAFSNFVENTILIISAVLLVVGFLVYIITNKMVD